MTPATPGPQPAGGRPPVVLIRHAAVGYDRRVVVQDASFRLDQGEVVALVGPNGCGKTTLVRSILGLATLMSGSLELFGAPAGSFRERFRIGYVPQRHTVGGAIPSTVREVVGSGRLPRKRLGSRMNAADRAAVAAAIETVGLADRARAEVATLSGGQQRRVLIARALASEPDVLVMDEPTAGVDAASQQALAATLGRLVSSGLTLLVVTHELAPLAALVDRVVAMEYGRIVHDGPAADALAAGYAQQHPGHDQAHSIAGPDESGTAATGLLGELRGHP